MSFSKGSKAVEKMEFRASVTHVTIVSHFSLKWLFAFSFCFQFKGLIMVL